MASDKQSIGVSKTKKRASRILLGVTGSVAAVKAPELAVRLHKECGMSVKILLTSGGLNFWSKAEEYNPMAWQQLQACLQETNNEDEVSVQIHEPDEEWKDWNRLGDPVLHIDLRDWADVILVAPLSAHTLAKISTGLADDTLSCVLRAWDWGHGPRPGKPVILAPAMNTAMWEHPLTQIQLDTVSSFFKDATSADRRGISIIPPESKMLACGEVGVGALASVDTIVAFVMKSMNF